MQRAVATLAIVLVLVGQAAPARADWQYTRWGMTQQELLAAGTGQVVPAGPAEAKTAPEQFEAIGKAPYRAGDFAFEALFLARDGRLALVRLRLLDPSRCDALEDSLKARYGPPRERRIRNGLLGANWFDAATRNTVQLTAHAGISICYLGYSGGDPTGL